MAQWWELTDNEIAENEEALLAKQSAYYNTFFGTEEGQQVLLDLKAHCYEAPQETAEAQLALIRLYYTIIVSCGGTIHSAKAAIEAEGNSIVI